MSSLLKHDKGIVWPMNENDWFYDKNQMYLLMRKWKKKNQIISNQKKILYSREINKKCSYELHIFFFLLSFASSKSQIHLHEMIYTFCLWWNVWIAQCMCVCMTYAKWQMNQRHQSKMKARRKEKKNRAEWVENKVNPFLAIECMSRHFTLTKWIK